MPIEVSVLVAAVANAGFLAIVLVDRTRRGPVADRVGAVAR
ncbi:hypothetical protein ACWFRF_07225 [Nocardia sp. NPDC055165]